MISETLLDDGLLTPEVSDYAERKYALVRHYAGLFSSAMKRKWDCRVCIDLFAGAGRARVKESGCIVSASPMLTLGVRDPFDRYVFCEMDNNRMYALRQRVNREHPERDVRYVEGDTNANVSRILAEIPRPASTKKVLTLCVADPFSMKTLHFATVRSLSTIFVDFLMLIPTHMDANRNEAYYASLDNRTVEEYLGMPDWRTRRVNCRDVSFGQFIADSYAAQMATLGFDRARSITVVYPKNNTPLYHLVVFSRNALAIAFWQKAKDLTDTQREFNLGL